MQMHATLRNRLGSISEATLSEGDRSKYNRKSRFVRLTGGQVGKGRHGRSVYIPHPYVLENFGASVRPVSRTKTLNAIKRSLFRFDSSCTRIDHFFLPQPHISKIDLLELLSRIAPSADQHADVRSSCFSDTRRGTWWTKQVAGHAGFFPGSHPSLGYTRWDPISWKIFLEIYLPLPSKLTPFFPTHTHTLPPRLLQEDLRETLSEASCGPRTVANSWRDRAIADPI